MPDLRAEIYLALTAFAAEPLCEAAANFFAILGYGSNRTLSLGSVSDFLANYDPDSSRFGKYHPVANWREIHLLFQLTSADIAQGPGFQPEFALNDPADLSDRAIQSYLFLALELSPLPEGKFRPRTDLCDLARAINRLFPMPALVLFKEGDKISIAITYRRVNKKDRSKDVVERKVTLIKDVSVTRPHPGHLAIIEDFSLPSLSAFRGRDIKTFTDLDNAWRESLSVELLRKRAYRMLADWYFWAREHAIFPPDAPLDADGKPSLHLIRLLTRVIFCWFVKEKTLPDGRSLIPYDLFDEPRISELLKDASPDACTYYTAILQNLFFATLNTEMDEPNQAPNRRFARKVTTDHMVHTLWRHQDQLRAPESLASLLRDVPFLNGGLFECLDDRIEIEGTNKTREIRVDGFSTDPAKTPRIPNFLFFGGERTADLSTATGNSQRTVVKVTPLLDILNGFVWTITESTPLEEEVALDPDLLGNVFENLLAAYNPETGTVARNATGSFYTPDYVVDWMIDQALEPLLLKVLRSQSKKNATRVRRLLDWDEPGHDFDASESALLIDALSRLRTLDPACGSGAFPMGLLKKLVRVIGKLNFNQEQIYERKLRIIENTLYGVDIQPLAVQIAKLRFFITLIVDQPIDPARPNYGILPLPNLETKIVPANTLLGLERGQLLLGSNEVRRLEHELKTVRHRYFTARRYQDKKALRKLDRDLCKQLATALVNSGECTPSDANRLVEWNPYNTNTHAGFFDPGWMFGLEGDGGKFDLVLGNPPYVRQEAIKTVTVRDSAGRNRPFKEVLKEQYECFTGTADLYVYFFERSLQLLRIGGMLSFITSNKYFRAAYGEKLRAYLLFSTAPCAILDFGDTDIFTAVAYPCIFVTEKLCDVERGKLPDPKAFENKSKFDHLAAHADRNIPVLAWKPGPSKVEFPAIFDRDQFSLSQKDLKPSGWRLESPADLRLLDRLLLGGTPLGEYCKGRFYSGIKPGHAKSFVVNGKTKADLIAEHSSSQEVFKPYLRGRDVKRWVVNDADLWVIYLPWHFPLQDDNSIKSCSKKAEDLFKRQYPAIYNHLAKNKEALTSRDRAETGIRYEWYALARPRFEYRHEFETQKIITGRFMDKPTFALDVEGHFNNNANSFIADAKPDLLGILNSSVTWFFLKQTCTDLQNGFIQAHNENIAAIPIPPSSPEQKTLCGSLAKMLIELHKPESEALPERKLIVSYFEQWLNGLVYELYFPGKLHDRRLHLFDETTKLLPTEGALPPAHINEIFAVAHDIKRPLRAMLSDLSTIEEVRIIEEAGD